MLGVSLIDRYLLSLPEYSSEMTQANMIEIYSYNGLLPTKKIIGKWTSLDKPLCMDYLYSTQMFGKNTAVRICLKFTEKLLGDFR